MLKHPFDADADADNDAAIQKMSWRIGNHCWRRHLKEGAYSYGLLAADSPPPTAHWPKASGKENGQRACSALPVVPRLLI